MTLDELRYYVHNQKRSAENMIRGAQQILGKRLLEAARKMEAVVEQAETNELKLDVAERMVRGYAREAFA